MDAGQVPSWAQLIDLMTTVREDEPLITGTVAVDHGSDPGQLATGWYSSPGSTPPFVVASPPPGRLLQVWRQADRLRIEDDTGRPVVLLDSDRSWTFAPDAEVPLAGGADRVRFDLGSAVAARAMLEDWVGQGPFHVGARWPVGTPVSARTVLGRAAWSVRVSPGRGDDPWEVTVDAATGTILELRCERTGLHARWTTFGTEDNPERSLFTWSGPATDVTDAEHRFHLERKSAAATRAAWFAEHVTSGPLELRIAHPVEVESVDLATGAFLAALGFGELNHLTRRPRSAQPWQPPGPGTWTRWSDADWDWGVQVQGTLTPDGLADLQRQLGSAP